MSDETKPSWGFRIALAVLMLLALALTALGLLVLVFPIDPNDFQATTGQAWEAFSSANPEIAAYLEREARLLAVVITGVGLLTLFVVWYGVRDRSEIAVKTMWTIPVVLVGVAAVFILSESLLLAGVSAGVAALVALTLAVARRWVG
jgi:hypothetical protein